jgi:hypothetical protein
MAADKNFEIEIELALYLLAGAQEASEDPQLGSPLSGTRFEPQTSRTRSSSTN